MSNERSDGAEQLLNYLAIGLEPLEAVAYYLVVDEKIPLKTVETAAWSDGAIENAFNSAERRISSNEHEIARDYWRSKRDEVDNYEEEIEDIEAALDLRAVRQILQNEQER